MSQLIDETNETPEAARLRPSTFRRLMGVTDGKVRPDASVIFSGSSSARYSKSEQETFFKNIFVTDPRSNTQAVNSEGLLNAFLPIHESIGRIKQNLDKLRVLAPEIDQAAMIRVTSIMSPNDLQNGVFKFSLPHIPDLDPGVSDRICTYLTEYFNDTLNIGTKSEKWIKQCLYGAGCTPIFLFPTTHFQAFRKDGLMNKDIISVEHLEALYHEQKTYYETEGNYEKISKKNIFSQNKIGIESISNRLSRTVIRHNLYSSVYSDLQMIDNETFATMEDGIIPHDVEIAIEKIRVTLTKELDEGDVIHLSENPEIVKFSGEMRNIKKNKIASMFDDTFDTPMYYKVDKTVSMQDYIRNNEKDLGHPFYMVLPPESVIPITVPGDTSEHLGYFILLNEYGTPLEYNEEDNSCGAPNVGAAHLAMFRGACGGNMTRYTKHVANSVFDHLLDQYIRAKLEDIGFDHVDVHKTNAIATVMFYRLLAQKRTTLVFVPENLMTYMAFDYRDDGTGRSLLEEIQYILALRANFTTAAVMAMANDAINHHTLSVTFDEKTMNPEQIIETLGKQYVEKKRMKLSIDPTDMSKNIARNAISIIPKNIPGIGGFEVENNTTPGQSVKPDNELIDHFTNMLVTALGVPYAALNQLGETEYSRSIVTTNLFFSKQIRRDQLIICKHIDKFVRTYIKYSRPLQLGILKIIENQGRVADPDIVDTRGTVTTNESKKDNQILLYRIMSGVESTLPIPNLAPDKAQIEELRTFISSLQELSNVVYADDLVPQNDEIGRLGLMSTRANWVRSHVIEMLQNLGNDNNIQFWTIEESGEFKIKWAELLQFFKDTGVLMQKTSDVLTHGDNNDGMMGGGMMGGDMGMMGGGMDMGMSGDPMSMGDVGGDMGAPEMGDSALPPDQNTGNSPNESGLM